MSKPIPQTKRVVLPYSGVGTPITLVEYVHTPFMALMASLYPKFAGYTKAERGYSAFAGANHVFVGSFAGMTLQSVRKNPLLEDKENLFVRALFGALHVAGYEHHHSVCNRDNYGTLRMWQKMGLGAKIDGKGKARSAPLTAESAAFLQSLIDECRADYRDIRGLAARTVEIRGPNKIALLLPKYEDLQALALPEHCLSVELA